MSGISATPATVGTIKKMYQINGKAFRKMPDKQQTALQTLLLRGIICLIKKSFHHFFMVFHDLQILKNKKICGKNITCILMGHGLKKRFLARIF